MNSLVKMVALISDKLQLLRGNEGREHKINHYSSSPINNLSNISKTYNSNSSSSHSPRATSMDRQIETIIYIRCTMFQNRHQAMTSSVALDKEAAARPSEIALVMWSPQGHEAQPSLLNL